MTMDLREEVARKLCLLDFPNRDPNEIVGNPSFDIPEHPLWESYLGEADAALSVIQLRSSVQPGVDGLADGIITENTVTVDNFARIAADRMTELVDMFAAFPLETKALDYQNWAQLMICAPREARSTPSNPGGWQTMESAPKDGTCVLVGVAAIPRSVGEAFWWQREDGKGGWQTWDGENHRRTVYDPGPTHWQPLPPSPGTAESGTFKLDLTKEQWLKRVAEEPDVVIGAGVPDKDDQQ